MARKDRIKELEVQKGDLHRVIPSLVNHYGQGKAAEQLGVSQATISRWLKDNGYINRPWWTKAVTPSEQRDIEAAAARVAAWRERQGEGS